MRFPNKKKTFKSNAFHKTFYYLRSCQIFKFVCRWLVNSDKAVWSTSAIVIQAETADFV